MTTETFFREHAGARVYVPRLPGNHGDHLMVLALQAFLRRYRMRPVWNPAGAELAVLRGNGAMNDFWRNAFDMFAWLSEAHPRLPVTVLPASYHFERTDFASLVRSRTAPCRLLAREQASLGRLASWGLGEHAALGLDHDTAFALRGGAVVKRWAAIRDTAARDYVLVVERSDVEHHGQTETLAAGQRWSPRPARRDAALKPLRAARLAWFRRRWAAQHQPLGEPISETFAEEVRVLLGERRPDFSTLPWRTGDVSDAMKYSFDDFTSAIAGAACIVTTRLHVGILGCLLGVPTFLRTGRYGKITGVYRQSMLDEPHVELFGPAWDPLGACAAGGSVGAEPSASHTASE